MLPPPWDFSRETVCLTTPGFLLTDEGSDIARQARHSRGGRACSCAANPAIVFETTRGDTQDFDVFFCMQFSCIRKHRRCPGISGLLFPVSFKHPFCAGVLCRSLTSRIRSCFWGRARRSGEERGAAKAGARLKCEAGKTVVGLSRPQAALGLQRPPADGEEQAGEEGQEGEEILLSAADSSSVRRLVQGLPGCGGSSAEKLDTQDGRK